MIVCFYCRKDDRRSQDGSVIANTEDDDKASTSTHDNSQQTTRPAGHNRNQRPHRNDQNFYSAKSAHEEHGTRNRHTAEHQNRYNQRQSQHQQQQDYQETNRGVSGANQPREHIEAPPPTQNAWKKSGPASAELFAHTSNAHSNQDDSATERYSNNAPQQSRQRHSGEHRGDAPQTHNRDNTRINNTGNNSYNKRNNNPDDRQNKNKQ
jgi:hypothetical protein